jgi:hypothetical protein
METEHSFYRWLPEKQNSRVTSNRNPAAQVFAVKG